MARPRHRRVSGGGAGRGYDRAEFDDLNGVRDRIARGLSGASPRHILDVGTGGGGFAVALGSRFPSAKVLGVDHVREYLPAAANRARTARTANCTFQQVDILAPASQLGRFGAVATFLALCDLLRFAPLADVFSRLDEFVEQGGLLWLSEAFPELAVSRGEALGFELNRGLGYVYTTVAELVELAESKDFCLLNQTLHRMDRRPFSDLGLAAYINDEIAFCTLDGSKLPDADQLIKEFTRYNTAEEPLRVDVQVLTLEFRRR